MSTEDNSGAQTPALREAPGLIERPGNNVDINVAAANLTNAEAAHNATVQAAAGVSSMTFGYISSIQ